MSWETELMRVNGTGSAHRKNSVKELHDYHHHPQFHHTRQHPQDVGSSLLEEQARTAHGYLEGFSPESP